MSDEPKIIPATGWFQMGKFRDFSNRALISLAIIIGGAILTGFENWVTQMVRDAPIPQDVITSLLGVNTWISSWFRSIVFPTATKLKE
jgi:hypothetical protein